MHLISLGLSVALITQEAIFFGVNDFIFITSWLDEPDRL